MKKKLAIFLAFIIGIVFFWYLQVNWLTVNTIEIKLKYLPNSFEKVTIIHITDLHSKEFGKNNQTLINRINRLGGDIIVMTGDMRHNDPEDEGEAFINLIKNLKTDVPIYYVTGEHEEGRYYADYHKLGLEGTKNSYEDKLRDLGVVVLNDEKKIWKKGNDKINIYGLSYKFRDEQTLDERLGITQHDNVNLLLVHKACDFEKYVDWGADLILSGDTHGGIVRIPFLGGLLSSDGTLFPEYDAGLYEKNNSKMFVSRGLGNHPVEFRLFNRPEIAVISLIKE